MKDFKDNGLLELQSRLGAIREHLEIPTQIDSQDFESAVIEAAGKKIERFLVGSQAQCGEDVLAEMAAKLQVRFEEVRDVTDIANLERKYLVEKGEIGFGQLEMELNAPGVDAILFQRMRASKYANDRWVAVLNLLESVSRGYWNRAHELTHRIAEPPQYNLPFYRHRDDRVNPLESLIDKTAADLAFYPPLFRPIVGSFCNSFLSWELVDDVREAFSPSASRRATANAILRYWPRPAYLLTARIRGRKNRPNVDRDLRISLEGYGRSEAKTLFFFPNMRVAPASPIRRCFQSGIQSAGFEQLGCWVTSGGGSLPDREVFTSAFRWRDCVLALISPSES